MGSDAHNTNVKRTKPCPKFLHLNARKFDILLFVNILY